MVLKYLRQGGGSVGMKELAGQIAAMENDVPISELTSQQRKRVYVSLYQTHLPKMAEMGAIEYNKEEGIVRDTEQTDEIDRYLTTPEQSTYPWKVHYLVLGISGGVALLLSLLTIPVFGALSMLWVSAGILMMFAISAASHYWFVQQRAEHIPIELN